MGIDSYFSCHSVISTHFRQTCKAFTGERMKAGIQDDSRREETDMSKV